MYALKEVVVKPLLKKQNNPSNFSDLQEFSNQFVSNIPFLTRCSKKWQRLNSTYFWIKLIIWIPFTHAVR